MQTSCDTWSKVTKDFGRLNRYEVDQTGEKIASIGLGTFFELAKDVYKRQV